MNNGPAKVLRRPPSASVSPMVTELAPARMHPREQVPVASVQGTLALDLHGHRGLPEAPELRQELRQELGVVDDDGRPVDDVSMWSARFAQAVVEVVGGDRPITQLVRWTTGTVYTELSRRVRILSRVSAVGRPRRTVRPQVRSVHVFQPTPACAEVSVHVRQGQRSRAIAARLERNGQRWQCTVLHLG